MAGKILYLPDVLRQGGAERNTYLTSLCERVAEQWQGGTVKTQILFKAIKK